jgi:hypothetical protein
MTKDEALKLALEALGTISTADNVEWIQHKAEQAITAIKQALAAPVQEPVKFFDWYDNAHWGNEDFKEGCHRSWNAAIKYTTPPAANRPWVGLTDEQVTRLCKTGAVYAPDGVVTRTPLQYREELEGVARTAVRKTEAKLKEKNT